MRLLLPFVFACHADKGITAFNSNPEVEISSHPDGISLAAGSEVTFRGIASDLNDRVDELSVFWYGDGQELCPE
ncbi:MAG: hypothetical protein VX278_13595, partial [Myxococcota bacterium]|nr:hypothetical protein [Myxococcota bacterium]